MACKKCIEEFERLIKRRKNLAVRRVFKKPETRDYVEAYGMVWSSEQYSLEKLRREIQIRGINKKVVSK